MKKWILATMGMGVGLLLLSSTPSYRDGSQQQHSFNTSLEGSVAAELDQVPGVEVVKYAGYNGDLDIAAEEVIWAKGGGYTATTTVDTLSIVSSSANDSATGTGARTILLDCIDAGFNSSFASVTMNGTSAVADAHECVAINSAYVVTAGSGGINAGNIEITRATGGTTLAYIPAGVGANQSCIYTVPADKQAMFEMAELGASSGTPVVKFFWNRYNSLTGVTSKEYRFFHDPVANSLLKVEGVDIPIPEKNTIWVSATTDTDNSEVSCRMKVKLVDAD